MAGPHVAGLVALLISADPDLVGDVLRIVAASLVQLEVRRRRSLAGTSSDPATGGM